MANIDVYSDYGNQCQAVVSGAARMRSARLVSVSVGSRLLLYMSSLTILRTVAYNLIVFNMELSCS